MIKYLFYILISLFYFNLSFSKEELAAAKEQEKLRLRALTRQKDLVERGVGTAAALENAELSASGAAQAVLTRNCLLYTSDAAAE